jgi:uncharacterized protein (DUF2336 family)
MTGAPGYEEAKHLARHGDAGERAQIAARGDLPAELLYFLAQDADAAVRRVVAQNRATPSQADALLARDPDYGVRCALARKAVGDGLAEEARRDLWRMGFTLLETLAVDRLVRVRKIISLALCSDHEAPHTIVVRLAGDPEEEVAAPVLERSPVLTENDISEIVARNAAPWARNAIAARAARLTPPQETAAPVEALALAPETPEKRAERLLNEGKLDDEIVATALSGGERKFVTAALALRAGVPPRIAERIVLGKSAKALVALAWKGKFPMRFALEAQRRLALIPPSALIYARNGIDYPFSPQEMSRHLRLFTD